MGNAYADFTIAQGTTSPLLTWQLVDSNYAVIDLTNATSVVFIMRKVSSSTPTVTAAATITNAEAGEVSYQWASADTASAGIYTAQFLITYSSGLTQMSPGDGYLEIMVEENLATTGATPTIVSLGAVKEYLNIPANDKSRDSKLLRFIRASVSVIENVTGPVVVRTFDEWYDGGQYHIMLRHPPSTGYGSNPVCTLNFVEVYIGPIEYQFTGVGTPVTGSIYTYEVDTFSRVVRRAPGGGIIPFPNMPQSVHIGYVAGQSPVPDSIAEANLELLRVNYQQTQQMGRPGWGGGSSADDDMLVPSLPLGSFLPGRVKEILGPTRRPPSVA